MTDELCSKYEKIKFNPSESKCRTPNLRREERARKVEANKCLNGLLKHFMVDKSMERVNDNITYDKSHHLSLKDLRNSNSERLVKSVNHLLDQPNSQKSLVGQESIEIIFISNESVDKVQGQTTAVDEKTAPIERENSKKKKKFVVWANESKKHKKTKQEKTLNCFLSVDEPFDNLEEVKSIKR